MFEEYDVIQQYRNTFQIVAFRLPIGPSLSCEFYKIAVLGIGLQSVVREQRVEERGSGEEKIRNILDHEGVQGLQEIIPGHEAHGLQGIIPGHEVQGLQGIIPGHEMQGLQGTIPDASFVRVSRALFRGPPHPEGQNPHLFQDAQNYA